MDLRCSGKDLVPNHLTFFIYNHCAVWSKHPEYWPRGIRANGHLMLNDAKMSKSTGNFLTAVEAIERYSADGVRFALADAGDGNDDANFKTETAEQAVTRLAGLIASEKELLGSCVEQEAHDTTKELIFQAQFYDCAARCNRAYGRCMFREGTIILMNEMARARDLYLRTCEQEGVRPSATLVRAFVQLHTQLLAVICPHVAEEVNAEVLGNKESVFERKLDQAELDRKAFEFARYINTYDQICQMIARLKMRYNDVCKPRKDGTVPPKPVRGTVYVATDFLEWQAKLIEFLGAKFEAAGGKLGKDIMGQARAFAMDELKVDPKETKKVIKFATDFVNLSKTEGKDAFVVRMPFDEKQVYGEYAFLIKQNLGLESVDVFQVGEGPVAAAKCAAAQPGRPIIFFDL